MQTCIFDRIHIKLINLSFQMADCDQLLLMVTGLFSPEVIPLKEGDMLVRAGIRVGSSLFYSDLHIGHRQRSSRDCFRHTPNCEPWIQEQYHTWAQTQIQRSQIPIAFPFLSLPHRLEISSLFVISGGRFEDSFTSAHDNRGDN